MSQTILMPSIGQSVVEAAVARWFKGVGDVVHAGEPLLEVATDKVDTEIPSPVTGVVEQILAPVDAMVEPGTPLVIIAEVPVTMAEAALDLPEPAPSPLAWADPLDQPAAPPSARRRSVADRQSAAASPHRSSLNDPALEAEPWLASPARLAEPEPRRRGGLNGFEADAADASLEPGALGQSQPIVRPAWLDDPNFGLAPSRGSAPSEYDAETGSPQRQFGAAPTTGSDQRSYSSEPPMASFDRPASPTRPAFLDRPTPTEPPASPARPSAPARPAFLDQPSPAERPPTPTRPAVPARPAFLDQPSTPVRPSTPARPAFLDQPSTPERPAFLDQPSPSVRPSAPERPAFLDQPSTAEQPPTPQRPAFLDQPALSPQPSPPVRPALPEPPSTPEPPPILAQPDQPAITAPPAAPSAAVQPKPPASPEPESDPVSPTSSASSGTSPTPGAPGGSSAGPAYTNPLVRRLADDLGIDLATVKGTGVGGRIRREDVIATSQAAAAQAQARAQAREQARTQADAEAQARVQAEAAAKAAASIPASRTALTSLEPSGLANRLLCVTEADMTRAGDAFLGHSASPYLPVVAAAVVGALGQRSAFNASVVQDKVLAQLHVNLAIALETDRGPIIPTIHQADQLDPLELADRVSDLVDRAAVFDVRPDELTGGTFTIIGTGLSGPLFESPVVPSPQVAALSIGAATRRAVVKTDADGSETIAIRTMVYLALACDRRLIDNHEAGAFLTDVRRRIERAHSPNG